jgi:acyl transferase domain-containing protein
LSSFRDYLDIERPLERDLIFTLGQRQTHMPYRAAFTADGTTSLKNQLDARSAPASGKATRAGEPNIAFIFTEQGAQYAQMGFGLLCHPIFADTMLEAEELLLKMGAKWSLKEEIANSGSASRIKEAELSQPACTALQIALVRLLRSFGIKPRAVCGHSSGEIAAAYAAGYITFQTAMAVTYFRGLAASETLANGRAKGAMLAVGASLEETNALLENRGPGYATIAAYNSPDSVTLSGDLDAIEKIQREAEKRNLFARRLKVGLAYHSRHMQAAAGPYATWIKPFCNSTKERLHESEDVTFVSSVTGLPEEKSMLDASY